MSEKNATASTGVDHILPRRFEFHQGSSDKFWSIELAGNSHTVNFGRVGTSGQSKTKEFADVAAARASYNKLVAQKTKKGYSEVGEASPPSQVKLDQETQPETFLSSILENPDEFDNYRGYANWLCERRDPRGELMDIQLRLEDETVAAEQRKRLQEDEKKLLSEHSRTWLDHLAPHLIDQTQDSYPHYKSSFARGFLDSLSIGELSVDFVHTLVKSPHCRMLRRLNIDYTNYEYEEGLTDLARGIFDNIREFTLGDEGHVIGEGVEELIGRMPRIETIELYAQYFDVAALFKLKMPCLRSLTVNNLSRYPLEVLAENSSLTRLQTIKFFPHAVESVDDAAYINLGGVRAICRSRHLGSLTHLGLYCSDMGNPGVQEIIESGLLSRLKVLDLTFGCITDEGARLLIDADLSGLDQLILSDNYISAEAIRQLLATGVNLQTTGQYSGEPDEEQEYLWNGDWE